MPLRSMRYEYYKMARKCTVLIVPIPTLQLLCDLDKLGFAEVGVKCPLPIALARNSARIRPILESAVVAMECSLEMPDPAQHHWERISGVLTNEEKKKSFTDNGW